MEPGWVKDFIAVPCEHPGYLFERDRIMIEHVPAATAIRRYGFAVLEPETGETGLIMVGVCERGVHHVYKAKQHWTSEISAGGISAADQALTLMHLEAWKESANNRRIDPSKGSVDGWFFNDHYGRAKKDSASSFFKQYVERRKYEYGDNIPYLVWKSASKTDKHFTLSKSQADASPLVHRIN